MLHSEEHQSFFEKVDRLADRLPRVPEPKPPLPEPIPFDSRLQEELDKALGIDPPPPSWVEALRPALAGGVEDIIAALGHSEAAALELAAKYPGTGPLADALLQAGAGALKTFSGRGLEAEAFGRKKTRTPVGRPEGMTGVQGFAHDVVRAAPSIGAVITAGATMGPPGAFAMGAALEGGASYEQALAEGVPEDQALVDFALTGSVGGSLEAIGGLALLRGGKAGIPLAARMIRGMAAEGTTEGLQELWSRGVDLLVHAKDEKWSVQDFINAAYAAGIGVVLGGGVSAGQSAFQAYKQARSEVGEATEAVTQPERVEAAPDLPVSTIPKPISTEPLGEPVEAPQPSVLEAEAAPAPQPSPPAEVTEPAETQISPDVVAETEELGIEPLAPVSRGPGQTPLPPGAERTDLLEETPAQPETSTEPLPFEGPTPTRAPAEETMKLEEFYAPGETGQYRRMTGDEAMKLKAGQAVVYLDEDGKAVDTIVNAAPKIKKSTGAVEIRLKDGFLHPLSKAVQKAGQRASQFHYWGDSVEDSGLMGKLLVSEGPAAEPAEEIGGAIEPPKVVRGVLGASAAAPIPLSNTTAAKIGARIASTAKRYFVTGGHVPKSGVEAVALGEGRRANVDQQMKEAANDYAAAFRRWTRPGGPKSSDAERLAGEAFHGGEEALTQLPDEMRGLISRFRNTLDRLSSLLIKEGVIEPGSVLEGVVGKNLGVYVRRTYRAHTDPDYTYEYVRDNEPHVLEAANDYVRTELEEAGEEVTDDQIEQMLRNEFDDGGLGAAVRNVARKEVTRKDLGVFKKRKNVPKEIRDLLGEHKSPITNYIHSYKAIAQILNAHETLRRIHDIGLEEGWLTEEQTGESRELLTPKSEAYSPLAPVFTTKDIQRDFDALTKDERIQSKIAKVYLTIQATAKIMKTVGGVGTHVRNVLSNGPLMIANGNWQIIGGKARVAVVQVYQKVRGGGTAEQRRLNHKALELGVIGTSVRGAELEALVRDLSDPESMAEPGGVGLREARRLVKRGAQKGIEVYQAEDDGPKMLSWFQETEKYTNAYAPYSPGDEHYKSTEEIEELTADIVRNTMPNYNYINPRFRRGMRRIPVGNFPSFSWEILRTRVNAHQIGRFEIAEGKRIGNEALVRIGRKRQLSNAVMVMLPGWAAAIGLASAMATGVDEEDKKAARRFMAPWSKYGDKIWLSPTTFIDLGYTDPFSVIRKPMNAAWRNREDPRTALTESLIELIGPWTDSEFMAKTLVELALNKKIDGDILDRWLREESRRDRQLVNKYDSKMAAELGSHVWKEIFEPGTVRAGRRVVAGFRGVEYGTTIPNPTNELFAFLGARVTRITPETSLVWRARSYDNSLRDARSVLNRELFTRGTPDEDRIGSAYEATQEGVVSLLAELHKDIEAARHFGMSERDILIAVMDGGIAKSTTRQLLSGRIPLHRPRPGRLVPRASEEFLKRLQDEYGNDDLRIVP